MDILFIFLIFITGFIFGWIKASKSMLDRILEKPETMMELLKKYKDSKDDVDSISANGIREIEVQNEKGSFYLYAKDNGEFLGQGNTLEEALEIVRKRFPGQNFHGHIDATNAKIMGLSK